MKQRKPICDLQTIEGKFTVLPAKLSECGDYAMLVEPCLFCGEIHRYEINEIGKYDIGDGILVLGWFEPACAASPLDDDLSETSPIEVELFDGIKVSNDNHIILVDASGVKTLNGKYKKVSHLVDRNIQLEAGISFWIDLCLNHGTGRVTTFERLFKDFQYCMRKTKLYRHEITAGEFQMAMRFRGYRSFYEKDPKDGKGEYVVSGISPKDTDCRSWAKVQQTTNFLKFWDAMDDCFHDEEDD